MNATRPLVFACAGCSNVAQLTYRVALELDRRGIAEMSCLAGVGAGKKHFIKKLKGREVWIIDGCPIECALGIFGLAREDVDVHIKMHKLGIGKHDQPSAEAEFEELISTVLDHVAVQRRTEKNDSTAPHAS